MNNSSELTTLENFTNILERLGIAYAISGSLASSTYGAVRFTEDADITVEPFDERAEELFESLKSNYYISKESMHQALRQQSSFNVIHFESAFKIDVFVSGSSAYDKQVLSRRKSTKLSDSLAKSFSVVSPEDIVLLKLQWYKADDQSSQRQWDDVLGVLRIQSDALDFVYLKKWAGILGIDELLEKAVSEAK
jgi:hypothetical protein